MLATVDRKRVRGAQTRAELIAAGIQVFAERGYHGASMDDIAAAAGTTRGALYWHFADKEDFLVALLEGIIARRNKATMDQIPLEGNAAQLLASSFNLFAETNFRMKWFARLMGTVGLDAESISPKVRELMTQALEPNRYGLARIIRFGQETGIFRKDLDADDLGALLAAFRTGLVLSWAIEPDGHEIRKTTRTLITQMLPALLSPKGRRHKIVLEKCAPEQIDAENAAMMRGYILAAAEARSTRTRKARRRKVRPVSTAWKEIARGDRTLRVLTNRSET